MENPNLMVAEVSLSHMHREPCVERSELVEFFNERLVVVSAIGSGKPMLNHLFFFVAEDEILHYRETFPIRSSSISKELYQFTK